VKHAAVAIAIATLLLAAGCSSSDVNEAEPTGQTAAVWRLAERDIDHGAELARLVEAVDWQYTDREHRDNRTDRFGTQVQWGYDGPGDSGLSIGSDNVLSWGYISEEKRADQLCRASEPTDMTEDAAREAAYAVWETMGVDRDSLAVRNTTAPASNDEPACYGFTGQLLIAGVPSDLRFVASVGGPDNIVRSASGFFVEAVEVGQVPLLAPSASDQRAGEDLTSANIGYEATRLPDNDAMFFVPVWMVSLNPDLPDVSLAATRRADVINVVENAG